MKKITTIILGMALAAAMFFAGRRCGRRADGGGNAHGGSGYTETRVDTLVLHDTLRYTLRDTVLVPIERYITRVDTVWLQTARDTIPVETTVPIERKTYVTDDYRAVVEGFRPTLVEMELYRKTALVTREITRTLPSRKWGVGIQAGYGLGPKGAGPYIGIGVQYRLADW